jgi:hypothetical protein
VVGDVCQSEGTGTLMIRGDPTVAYRLPHLNDTLGLWMVILGLRRKSISVTKRHANLLTYDSS